MKIDPYNHKEKYTAWKESVKNGIPLITKENSDLIMNFLHDMEIGANIATESVKGARSYIRLNTLRDKLCFFAKNFDKTFNLRIITDIKEEKLFQSIVLYEMGWSKQRIY